MQKTEYFVDNGWLANHLDHSQVKIIDCRFQLADSNWGQAEYNHSHIQGAYYLNLDRDLSSPVQQYGGRHPLPNINTLTQKFEAMGIIKNETLVVAYDDSRFAFAARLWWLLKYLGHNSIVLLDGGWHGWQKNNYPLDNIIPESKSGSFTAEPNLSWLVDIDDVKFAQHQDSTVIVDSRDRDRYLGIEEPIDPIAGSISGAVNSPWKQISDESGYLKSKAVQQKLWQDYQQAENIIVYCGSGVTACVNLFSLSLAGFKNTKLYGGGWSDWCSCLTQED